MGLSYGRSAPLSLKKGELSVGVICCLINMISCFDNFNIHQNERLCCKVSSLSRALFFCRVYGQPVYSRKGFRVVLRGTRQAILEPARLAFPSGLEPAVSANGDSVLDCAESGPRKKRSQDGNRVFRSAALPEHELVSSVFRAAEPSCRPSGDHPALARYSHDHRAFQGGFSHGGLSACAVPDVGQFCRVSELYDMAA